MYPLVYAFLPNKTHETYPEEYTIESGQHIFFYFERGSQNAATIVCPNVTIKGCLFHYGQCLWRKIQSCGLQSDYSNNDDINKFVRRTMTLSLVPVEKIEDVWFQTLGEVDSDDRSVVDFSDYVTETWVENNCPMWNHYETEGPRTTNHLEGWHHKLNNQMHRAHPYIIKLLQTFQSANEIKIIQLAAGGKKRKKEKQVSGFGDKASTVEREQINVMDYTGAVSHILKHR
ncbi:hypothetical protein KUTeg_000022 [Tegillarca granosa]|uniref:Uncharacterized protein n=1 Tax=Tegillarca granosa TaxID=220873 RepID=A0ABQ9G062_TEGGR|nr:hypothetical protein KUTeg_000022 [Tegillarca granosa]